MNRNLVLLAIAALVAAVVSVVAVANADPIGTQAVPPTPQVTTTVATNLTAPWGLAFLPDGSALVSERDSAQIKRIAGGTVTTVGTVPGVQPGGEGGLLGIAVAPTFATDRMLYAYFTSATDNRVVRMRFDTGLGTPEVLISGIAKNTIHNGGRLAFGPDGMLYVSTGDAGNSANSQNPNSLNGKILRVTPTGAAAPGNPTAGNRMWTLGHRNVQGMAWDPAGRMYASEFGQNTWDELNLIQPGRNYGWPTVEGTANNPSFVDPIVQWPTSQASPSGIAFAGNTVWLAALAGQRLWAVPVLDGALDGTPVSFFSGMFGRLRLVTPAPDGSLWLITNNTDGRGTPRTGDDRILRLTINGNPPTSTTTTTTTSTTTTTTTSTTPPPAGACRVSYAAMDWGGGGGFTANITLTNTSATTVNGWTLAFTFPAGQRITPPGWSATWTQAAGSASVTATNLDWNRTLAPNAATQFGFNGTFPGTNTPPTAFTLNGTPCSTG
jgi:glucose/arabinose dehydrogenase